MEQMQINTANMKLWFAKAMDEKVRSLKREQEVAFNKQTKNI